MTFQLNANFQDFLNDQARTMSRVARYCEQAKLSRPVNAYLYTYDSSRDFLVCRNHKVTQFCIFYLFAEAFQISPRFCHIVISHHSRWPPQRFCRYSGSTCQGFRDTCKVITVHHCSIAPSQCADPTRLWTSGAATTRGQWTISARNQISMSGTASPIFTENL